MKRVLFLAALVMLALPALAQSKEEKKQAAEAAYKVAVECLNNKSFVLVPASYYNSDGEAFNNDNTNFLSYETTNAFTQGRIVCGNDHTNIMEVTSYKVETTKKGDVKVEMQIKGRMLSGMYRITLKAGGNMADVVFNVAGGSSIRFSGPVVPVQGADYFKRSNPM